MSSSQLAPGEMVGGYRIVRKLGGGGMGEVYEAWEDALQRRVALKILAPNSLSDIEALERFRGEGRALARLRHPNVVTLYTVGEHKGRSYLALEFIDGWPLNEFLADRPCGLKHMLELFRQMLEGLGAAHAAGIIHRDLKPANIVIDQSLNAKLVDFGIAKVHADHRSVETEAHIVMGTANFLAPEVALGQSARTQSDIYSLGLVFFYMLSGENPFDGRNNLETLEKIRTLELKFNPHLENLLPGNLKSTVLKMTAKSLQERYLTAAQALEDLGKTDLAELPEDLSVSVFPKISLENAGELRAKCAELGFSTGEIRYIVNLAAGIQAARPAPADRTAPLEAEPKLHIDEDALKEAVARFRNARVTHSHRRTRAQFRRRALKALITAALFALAAFLGFRAMKPSAPAEGFPMAATKVGQVEKYIERQSVGKNVDYEEITTARLAAVENGIERWENNEGGIERYYPNPFFPMHSYTNDEGKLEYVNDVTGDLQALFPLKAGNRSEVTVKNAGAEYKLRCFANGMETKKVTMGTFDMMRVSCERDRAPFVKTEFLYSPRVGRWVVMEERDGAKTNYLELISVTPPAR
jgi:hypothetical protein